MAILIIASRKNNPNLVSCGKGLLALYESKGSKKEIFLLVLPARGQGYMAISSIYTGSPVNAQVIKKSNKDLPVLKDRRVKIPFSVLLLPYQERILKSMFRKDTVRDNFYIHVVRYPDETISDISRWFTGGNNIDEIRKINNIKNDHHKGNVKIPISLLKSFLKPRLIPSPPTEKEKIKEEESPKLNQETLVDESAPILEYGKDPLGSFAVYKLKAGEALYSSVVVRFTGRLSAKDVNELAITIAKRSGITDVTSIPVGYSIKIPLDELLPEYQPPDSLKFKEWRRVETAASGYKNTYKAKNLDGVVIILDPGHGGIDPGAMANGICEHDYVYDIICRIKEGLERTTMAKVMVTLINKSRGFEPQDSFKCGEHFDEYLITTPWFRHDSFSKTAMEVNLRWYLVNSYYKNLTEKGIDGQRILFTSVHADSLHPSLSGSMYYVPGALYRKEKYGKNSSHYRVYREVVEQPFVTFSQNEKERNQGFSTQFARIMMKTMKEKGLKYSPFGAIRDHVIRGGKSWVPAVIRYSTVPTSILWEVGNINNKNDAMQIAKPENRQKLADAYIESVMTYYAPSSNYK